MPPGQRCCIVGCQETSHKRDGTKIQNGLSFYVIPKVKEHAGELMKALTTRRRRAWISAIRRPDVTFERFTYGLRVCSKHFHKGAPSYEMLESDPDWMPSLHLGHGEVTPTNTDRYARRQQRSQVLKDCINLTDGEIDNSRDTDSDSDTFSKNCDAMCQTDLSCNDINEMEMEIMSLKNLNKKCIDGKITIDSFTDDDEKVNYFTALPTFFVLTHLFNYLKPHFPSKRVVSPFQMLMIVFLRLRLNLPIQFIAYFFHIHRSTVSNIFMEALSIMYVRMSPMIFWPNRECLQTSMPHEFVEAFGSKVAVIIDCFEIFIERPSNLKARAETFSHYKHNHTIKYLIGIAPQGVITFISKGWGGRTSDKYITEHSKFLDNLLPGDIVLADRGFDIKESVSLMCAEVKIPSFTRGRCQMEAKNIEDTTRKLAHLRIHVERVIGTVVGKYSILSDTVPLNLVLPCEGEDCTVLDKIVTVACVLTNLCPSVVRVV